jgi:hypothetical protein
VGVHKWYTTKAAVFIASLLGNRGINKRLRRCSTAVKDRKFSGVMHEQVYYFSGILFMKNPGERVLLVREAYLT